MLEHIFKNKFIKGLRRLGYSKKQAGRIYERFAKNRLIEGYTLEGLIQYATERGDGINPINYRLFTGAFVWSQTPQGQEYWSDICDKLRGNRTWPM